MRPGAEERDAAALLRAVARGDEVALDQAREPIAIWLAILATRPPVGELTAGLGGLETGRGFRGVEVRNTMVATWNYPGAAVGTTPSGPQLTAVGYLLAKAMTGLPERKVSQVLTSAWATWLNERTTDAQLAAALGLRMPSVSLPPPVRPGFKPAAAAACVGRSRYADLGGAIAAPVTFTAIAVAWYAPSTSKFLVEPPATALGVTLAWYAIASAALILTCAAMRDSWHRYSRAIHRSVVP